MCEFVAEEDMVASAERAPGRVPRGVRLAGALVGLEGLAGLAFVVSVLVSGAQSWGNRLGEAGYFLLLSVGIVAVAVGLLRGRPWARTPAAVLQVLLIGVAYYALNGAARPEIGIPVAVYGVVVIVLLFTRRARDWAWGQRDAGESATHSATEEPGGSGGNGTDAGGTGSRDRRRR